MGRRLKRVDYGPCRRVFRPQENIYLEQRAKANRPTPNFRYKWTAFMVLAVLTMFSGWFTYSYSCFADTAKITNNSFEAAHINKFLRAYPGKALANYFSWNKPKGKKPTVAQYNEDGELELDFGEVTRGNSANFQEVLLLENISEKELLVSYEVIGEIATVFENSGDSFYLLPNETTKTKMYSLNLKFEGHNPPGLYEGFLIIKAEGEFLKIKIPARVIVRESGNANEIIDSVVGTEVYDDRIQQINNSSVYTTQIESNDAVTKPQDVEKEPQGAEKEQSDLEAKITLPGSSLEDLISQGEEIVRSVVFEEQRDE